MHPANDDDDLPGDLPLSEEDEAALADLPQLAAVVRFARMLGSIGWFRALGEPLGGTDRATAESYAAALGFPDAYVATVADWEEAEAVAGTPDWNSEWWEVEEQLRAALTAEAGDLVGDELLEIALTHVAAKAAEGVREAAETAAMRGGNADDELIRAAAGAAIQACHQAALVLAADGDADHPFALKFRLFEAGRWPLGIAGTTLNLF